MAWQVNQLADAVEQTTSYIRRLLRDGTIKGEKFGRDWAIPDDEAEKYIASVKAKAAKS